MDEEGTDPALVVSPRALPGTLYRRAVSEVVTLEEVEPVLEAAGAVAFTHGTPRGIIGAAASIAWPARRATWELIAYRPPSQTGRRRSVDRETVLREVARTPSLFLCADPRTRRLLVAPHTPCPIVLGLRATRRTSLLPALRRIRSEPVERWTIFRTNQGTGDHLRTATRNRFAAYSAGIVEGPLAAAPRSLRGGHVALDVQLERRATLHAVVFEPSKTLPRVALALEPGDRVRLWGGWGSDPTLRVEGIEVVSTVPRYQRSGPRCVRCDRPAHSVGRGRGYRCRECRALLPPESDRAGEGRPSVPPGIYHPTPSARRHLHPRGPEGWEFVEPSSRANGLS